MRLSPHQSLLAGCLAAVLLVLSGAALAAEHVVAQKNKAFSMKKLTVKVGDTVKFVNEDSFAHNVFSLSAPKSFDLGSFGNGGSKSVTFDKPGKVEVECAVHPDMRLDVEVTAVTAGRRWRARRGAALRRAARVRRGGAGRRQSAARRAAAQGQRGRRHLSRRPGVRQLLRDLSRHQCRRQRARGTAVQPQARPTCA